MRTEAFCFKFMPGIGLVQTCGNEMKEWQEQGLCALANLKTKSMTEYNGGTACGCWVVLF